MPRVLKNDGRYLRKWHNKASISNNGSVSFTLNDRAAPMNAGRGELEISRQAARCSYPWTSINWSTSLTACNIIEFNRSSCGAGMNGKANKVFWRHKRLKDFMGSTTPSRGLKTEITNHSDERRSPGLAWKFSFWNYKWNLHLNDGKSKFLSLRTERFMVLRDQGPFISESVGKLTDQGAPIKSDSKWTEQCRGRPRGQRWTI